MAGSLAEADQRAALLIEDLRAHKFGYAWPVLHNNDTRFAWDLRKAGLGLLRNLPGDTQPVNLIEDCAVAPEELPAYIDDLQVILRKYNVNASYYAHAGAGELHVEPMINLKTSEGVKIFRSILAETVELIKKYRGSLSGEHGDGRLRGEYIAAMTGTGTYRLFEEVKNIFDPKGIFNKGKITATPPMDAFLRVQQNLPVEQISTSFDFSAQGGMLALAEKCSGSGDCRKTALSGGTMCPSYMATRAEKDTTRARANLLRQFLSDPQDSAPLTHREIKEVMDLCLSCKGCKIECPSSVDITKMKAEFLHQYQQKHGFSFRSRLIGNFSRQMRIASILPWVYNTVVGTPALRSFTNRLIGFHPKRSMPALAGQSLRNWFKKLPEDHSGKAKVYFFCDEFTNFLDVEIGKKAIMLLRHLGYQVIIPDHVESGRSFLSKGLLNSARNCIRKNLQLLAPLVNQDAPLVGLEPSAILSFRDEYIDLAPAGQKEQARELAKHVFTIEEFISNEIEKGNISSDQFTEQKKEVVMHGHCYQKVLSSQQFTYSILTLPKNYVVQVIPSGCCGMAGSFGYEAEHYEVSQQVGELVLFPALRKQRETTIIAAAGTSCRHQIKDGTGKMALHPVEILWEALKG